ncbi:hypothetical protein [Thermogymnomonas acidicola]|nr:hypothetical protein [Thermogymnomonas acidicola]
MSIKGVELYGIADVARYRERGVRRSHSVSQAYRTARRRSPTGRSMP